MIAPIFFEHLTPDCDYGPTAAIRSKKKTFSEAELEGALSNDSLTDAEKQMLRKEEISIQEANKRRNKDNQLAHAIDLIEGLSVLSVIE